MRCCIKLGIFLAQLLAYPQKKSMCPFCPRWRDSANRVRRTGFASMQVLVVQRKKRVVHTQGPALLLRLCFYKDIKEEDRRTTGNRQRRPMRYAGQALAMEKTGNTGVGSQVWGFWCGAWAFKGRQAAHNALDDINCWGGALQLRSPRKAPWRGWRSWASGAHCPQKTKAVGAAGKTGTGCRQYAQPCRACVRKASRSATGSGLLNR